MKPIIALSLLLPCIHVSAPTPTFKSAAHEQRAIVLLEVEDSGSEVFHTVFQEASKTYHLKFCDFSCDRRRRWMRNREWRHSCRTLVGPYAGGLCPGDEYYVGSSFLPCAQFVSLRHPVARVLSSWLSCQSDEKLDKCASTFVSARGVGFRRWAEHQRNFVLLRLAQDGEAVVGPEHPEACSNPAGCVHHTPCWFKHNTRIQLDGDVHATAAEAKRRLKRMSVLVQERFAESLKLIECKTGLSTAAYRSLRRSKITGAIDRSGGGRSSRRPVDANGDGEEGERREESSKFDTLLKLMKKDPEILELLRHEIQIYEKGVKLFERELAECGIIRNGSRIIVRPPSPAMGEGTGGLAFSNAASIVGDAALRDAALRDAKMRVESSAEQAIHDVVQRHHARRGRPGGQQVKSSEFATPSSNELPDPDGNGGLTNRIGIIDNRKRRGGLSRIHQEQFGRRGGLFGGH